MSDLATTSKQLDISNFLCLLNCLFVTQISVQKQIHGTVLRALCKQSFESLFQSLFRNFLIHCISDNFQIHTTTSYV